MFIYLDQQVGKGLARTDEERYAFVSPYSVGQRKVNRSADSRQGQSKKARAYLHSVTGSKFTDACNSHAVCNDNCCGAYC